LWLTLFSPLHLFIYDLITRPTMQIGVIRAFHLSKIKCVPPMRKGRKVYVVDFSSHIPSPVPPRKLYCPWPSSKPRARISPRSVAPVLLWIYQSPFPYKRCRCPFLPVLDPSLRRHERLTVIFKFCVFPIPPPQILVP